MDISRKNNVAKFDLQQALVASGYNGEPTEANVTACFLDYAAAGYWSNLSYGEALEAVETGEIGVRDMVNAFRS